MRFLGLHKRKFRGSVLLAICALVIFNAVVLEDMSTRALYNYDEARYAEVAKNMIKTGNYFAPVAGGPFEPRDYVAATLENGEEVYPYMWKPFLHPFLIAISMNMFGVHEFAARLPTLIAALGTTIMFFFLVERLAEGIVKKKSEMNWIPYVATILFITLNDFLVLSSQGLAEILMLFFSLGSIYAVTTKMKHRYMVAGILWGLAFLTKSFAVFWPPMIIAWYIFMYDRKDYVRKLFLFVVGGAVVTIPWMSYMYILFQSLFLERFIVQSLLQRAFAEQPNSVPLQWYGIYILDVWKPYILLAGFSFGYLFKDLLKKHVSIFALITGIVFVVFSMSESKVWWYIFPGWVGLSVLITLALHKMWQQRSVVHFISAVLLISLSFHPFWQLSLRHTPIKEFVILSGIVAVIAAALTYLPVLSVNRFTRKNLPTSIMTIFVSLIVITLVGVGYQRMYSLSLSRTDDQLKIKTLAQRNQNLTALGIQGLPYESILFYFDTGNIRPQDEAQYLVTTESIESELGNYWQRIDNESDIVLLRRF